MKSSASRGIIRGVAIDKVVFCTPSGETETEQHRQQQDEENLKALEQYWYAQGSKEGHAKGFEEGFAEGKAEGQRRGLKEGLEQGKEEGLAEGIEKGRAEGVQQAQEELEQLIQPLTAAADGLRKEWASASEQLRASLISLVLTVSEQILRKELSNKESYSQLLEMLFQQSASILKGQSIDLVLAQEDYALINGELDKLKINPQLLEKIHLLSDPKMARGDCRVETEYGLLNFDIKRQLQTLEKHLLEVEDSDEKGVESPEVEADAEPREGN